MSVYDCVDTLLPMFSALSLLYWAWLPDTDKVKGDMKKIYRKLVPDEIKENGKKLIESVHTECQTKTQSLTAKGLGKKARILSRNCSSLGKKPLCFYIFTSPHWDNLRNIYQFSNKISHWYIVSMMNKRHSCCGFFQCFLKSEVVNKYSSKLQKIDLNRKPCTIQWVIHVCLGKEVFETNTCIQPLEEEVCVHSCNSLPGNSSVYDHKVIIKSYFSPPAPICTWPISHCVYCHTCYFASSAFATFSKALNKRRARSILCGSEETTGWWRITA